MQNRPRPVPNSNIQFGCDIRTNLWKSNESKRLNDENNFFCLKLNMVKNLRLKIVLARKRPVCCTLYSKKHTCIIVVSVCILQSIMYFSCVTATNSHCTQRCFHLISHVVFSFSSFFSLFFLFSVFVSLSLQFDFLRAFYRRLLYWIASSLFWS